MHRTRPLRAAHRAGSAQLVRITISRSRMVRVLVRVLVPSCVVVLHDSTTQRSSDHYVRNGDAIANA
jgi:hypothetical protein